MLKATKPMAKRDWQKALASAVRKAQMQGAIPNG